MTVDSTIQRAKRESASGRLWRAKEILGSSIPEYGYSPDIFMAYADVLLAMGDDLDAGRFYLLSIDQPDSRQERVMRMFLQRHKSESWRQLLSHFPNAARISKRDSYPVFLRNHLSVLDAPEFLTSGNKTVSPPSFADTWLIPLGCIVVAVSAAICTIVGAYTIATWIRDLV
jgi:hypothetical protein